MNNTEAFQLLDQRLAELERQPYHVLVRRIGTSITEQVVGESGTRYQVEYSFMWDGRPGGAVRVIGSIDDGGWRALVPLSRGFFKSPDTERHR